MPNTPGNDERQRFLDRCFECLKHAATLSTAAALLILAIYREAPFVERLLAVTGPHTVFSSTPLTLSTLST